MSGNLASIVLRMWNFSHITRGCPLVVMPPFSDTESHYYFCFFFIKLILLLKTNKEVTGGTGVVKNRPNFQTVLTSGLCHVIYILHIQACNLSTDQLIVAVVVSPKHHWNLTICGQSLWLLDTCLSWHKMTQFHVCIHSVEASFPKGIGLFFSCPLSWKSNALHIGLIS